MLELLILIGLTSSIGKTVEAKGHKSGKYKWMTVGLWFGGEIVGVVIGAVIGTLLTGGDDSVTCITYIVGLAGAAVGAAIANSIAKNLEPMPGYPITPGSANLSGRDLPIQASQQGVDQPVDPAEMERRRVEKLGIEVAVCPNCQTSNSLSLINCEKCNTNIEKVKPIRNPYM